MIMSILMILLYLIVLMFPSVDKIFLISVFMVMVLIFMKNQHLAIILIQLEILTILLLFILTEKMIFLESNFKLIYVIMSLAVIEVAVGLSLVVKYARYFSKEFLKFTI